MLDEHKQHLLKLASSQGGALLAASSVAAAQVQLAGGAGGGVGVAQQLCKGLPAPAQQDLSHFLRVCGERERGVCVRQSGAALLPSGWLHRVGLFTAAATHRRQLAKIFMDHPACQADTVHLRSG